MEPELNDVDGEYEDEWIFAINNWQTYMMQSECENWTEY